MKFFRGVTDNLKPISLNPFEVVSVEGVSPFWSVMTTHGARTIKFDGDLVTELEACANHRILVQAHSVQVGEVTAIDETVSASKKRIK